MKSSKEVLDSLTEAARSAEKVILFLGFSEHWDTEGYDRFDIDLAEGLREIYRAVKSLNPNTAAVLCGGGVKNIAFLSDAGAILETFLAGEGYGEALPLILSGKISPSGRLAETIPCRLEDTPSYLSMSFDGKEVFYGESIFVGYRYYNAKNIKTLYPFGFGLSYTHFEYSDLELEAEGRKAVLEFSLENAGAYDAKETVLIFYEKKDSEIIRAGRQLCAFEKLFLRAGEKKKIRIEVDFNSLMYFDEEEDSFRFEDGEYIFYLGKHAEEMLLWGSLSLSDPANAKRYVWHENSTLYEIYRNSGEAALQDLIDHMKKASGKNLDLRDIFELAPPSRANNFKLRSIWNHPLRALISQYEGRYTRDNLLNYIDALCS